MHLSEVIIHFFTEVDLCWSLCLATETILTSAETDQDSLLMVEVVESLSDMTGSEFWGLLSTVQFLLQPELLEMLILYVGDH